MITAKITPEGGTERTARVDFKGFEWGKALDGNYCRIAHHGEYIYNMLTTMKQGQRIHTCGNLYERI